VDGNTVNQNLKRV